MKTLHKSLCLLLLVLLASCTQLAKLPEQADWQVSGKLSLKTPQENEQGRFSWSQYGETWHLQLFSSLGNTLLDVIGKPDFIQLKQLGKKPMSSEDPDAFLLAETGMALPVNELPFWLLGQPHPQTTITSQTYNESGQLMLLQQKGWQVNFAYDDQGRTRKLKLNKDDPLNGSVQLMIVNKVWE